MPQKKLLMFSIFVAIVLLGSFILHRSKPENNELVRSIYGPDFDCRNALNRSDFIRKNAEAGHAKSQLEIANFYFHGYNAEDKAISVDRAEALKWYLKAAEQGNMEAQYHLGILYASDLGIVAPNEYEVRFARKFKSPPNYEEAAKWFQMAAEQGDVNSQYYLSYQFRDGLGVKQDY